MTAAERALAHFDQGYSCAQAVFSALAEPRGLERDTAFRIAAGFGGGLARSGRTCGCITGAVMALGLAQADVSPEQNRTEKEKTYARVQCFLREFAARHSSTQCLDLLGCDISTPQGLAYARQNGLFQSRCAVLVRSAVELAEPLLPGRG